MLKSFAKSTYYTALALLGAYPRRLNWLVKRNEIAVLNLHSVSPKPNPYWPPLEPEIFEELLKFLQANFDVLGLNEIRDHKFERPVAVLSFDDGYYDFIEYALPLIEKYRMKANMNIIPECTETGQAIWSVRLYNFLNEAPRQVINNMDVPGFTEKLASDTSAAKLDFGLKISRFLKSRPRLEREDMWLSIVPFLDSLVTSGPRMMNAEETRQLSSVVDIGAHSYSHESMGYESDEFFETDFHLCRNYFDSVLMTPLKTYAFPNGSYRPEQINFLRDSGVENILLVDEKFSKPSEGVFTRLTMYGDSRAEICMRALGY